MRSLIAVLNTIVGTVGRRELAVLAAILLCAGLLYLFIEITEDVIEGETRAIDRAILLALRNPADLADPIGPTWVDIMMRDVTSLGSTPVLTILTLAAAGYLLMTGKGGAALFVVGAVASGALISQALKIGLARPRPDVVAHVVEVHTASFPSGHAMLSAVTFLTLGALLARIEPGIRAKAYWLALAVVLCLAHARDQPGLPRGALSERRACRLGRRGSMGHRLLAPRTLAAASRPDERGHLADAIGPLLYSVARARFLLARRASMLSPSISAEKAIAA